MFYKHKKQNRKYHFLNFGTNIYLQKNLLNCHPEERGHERQRIGEAISASSSTIQIKIPQR
jgi:hypothetical protein